MHSIQQVSSKEKNSTKKNSLQGLKNVLIPLYNWFAIKSVSNKKLSCPEGVQVSSCRKLEMCRVSGSINV